MMGQRFIVLDSWRGLAALLVAFGHLNITGVLGSLQLGGRSFHFVDFFFVLSGFVIAHSSAAKLANNLHESRKFIVRRLFRLWPLHAFILLLFVGYQLALLVANNARIVTDPVAFYEQYDLAWLPLSVLLIQAWWPMPYNTWNEPAWSISAELFAYLVFAGVSVMGGRRTFAIMTAIGLACATFILFRPETMAPTGLALVRCMAGFGLGVMVYAAYARRPALNLPMPSVLEPALIVLVFASVIYLPVAGYPLLLPIFALTVFVFAFEQGAVSRVLKFQIFQYLGERSYSIYLVHAFIMICVYSVAAVLGLIDRSSGKAIISLPGYWGDVANIAYLAVVVIVSAITYRFIELPGQALGKRWLARRAPQL